MKADKTHTALEIFTSFTTICASAYQATSCQRNNNDEKNLFTALGVTFNAG
jgi:hypothetical protein